MRMADVHVGDVVKDDNGVLFTVDAIRDDPRLGIVRLLRVHG